MVAHAERQAVNTPIQSAAADNTFIAGFIRPFRYLQKHPEFDVFLLMNVHDSAVFEVREEQLSDFVCVLRKIMEKPVKGPGGKSMRVPMKIDLAVGKNLGEMKDFSE